MDERFSRTVSLIGEKNLNKLKNSVVAVFGIGGVGSYAAAALARSGVGCVYLYDNDTVGVTNINRQLVASQSTLGEKKVAVCEKMLKDINPDIKVFAFDTFVTPESEIPFDNLDFIIDAVDNVTAKLFIIDGAKKHGKGIISVMGTGNKLYPERLRIDDIKKTESCPLCRVMRKELKVRGIENVPVVWTDEIPIHALAEDTNKGGSHPPASMVFVPACAGMLAASYVVRKIIDKE